MSFWLESLQENAFDVFIVTIIIVSIIIYHYLQKWYISKKIKEIEDILMAIHDEVIS
tara:strand:- start:1301 stop:1471 length:171 start_codon:yes stop_codon:yes gene_type:complete